MEVVVEQRTVLSGHESAVYTLRKGFGEATVWSGGGDKLVAEWSLEGEAPPRVVARSAGVIYSLLGIEQGNLLMIGNNQGGIHVVDLERKAEVKYFLGHSEGVFDMQRHALTQRIFASGADGKISVWEQADFHCTAVFKVSTGKVRQLAFSPDGSKLAICDGTGEIVMWDPFELREIYRWKAHELSVNALQFSPNGQFLISGSRDAWVKVWDTSLSKASLVHESPAHNYAVYSIGFSPDGRLMATASRDKTIKIWDAHTFAFLFRIGAPQMSGHVNSVNKVVWHPYRNSLISASDDRTVRVWDIHLIGDSR